MISMEMGATNMTLRSKTRFGVITYTVTNYNFPSTYTTTGPITIGGSIGKTSVIQSLQGIINRVWFDQGSSEYTDASWEAAYSFSSMICFIVNLV